MPENYEASTQNASEQSWMHSMESPVRPIEFSICVP